MLIPPRILGALAALLVGRSHAFAPPRPARFPFTRSSLSNPTKPLYLFSTKDEKVTLEQPRDVADTTGGMFGWATTRREADDNNNNKNLVQIVGKDGTDRASLRLENAQSLGLGAAMLAAGALALTGQHGDVGSIFTSFTHTLSNVPNNVLEDPTAALESVVGQVQDMGALGLLYFGAAYTVAEILAIPAMPLSASAGYLFGVTEGTLVVLVAASLAAAISFGIGRTLLRRTVEEWLTDYPTFKKIDGVIGKEGFRLMLLLRLSPVFPFALSNYLYGASSVKFWPYFWGTMLGFLPGTVAYVYTGQVGKALTLGGGGAEAQPWYVYACGLALLGGILKLVADVATSAIEGLEEEEGEERERQESAL